MNFGDIGASGLILLVIVVFALLGFAKGALKLFYGFLCLIGTLIAGWAGYQFGYPLVLQKWPTAPEYSQCGCALIAAIVTFLLLKTLTDFFSSPFSQGEEVSKKKGSSLLGLLTGFILGVGICLLAMHRLVDKGTRAEIDYWVAQASEAAPDDLPNLARLKDSFLKTAIGKKISRYISPNDIGSQNLTKLAIMQVAAPEKLEALAGDPAIATTLESPQLQEFLRDPAVKENIENGNTDAILEHPGFLALMANPELNHAIAQIDIEQALKLR